MKALVTILLAGALLPFAAQAQEWQAFSPASGGFGIEFPATPAVQSSRIKDANWGQLPVTRYTVRQEHMLYSVSDVDYSGTNADALTTITETARTLSTTGKVIANAGTRIGRYHGRAMRVDGADGSHSAISIFFLNKHLYTIIGQALPPNATDAANDAGRFQESLEFPDDNGVFARFFGGTSADRQKPVRAAAASPGASTSSIARATNAAPTTTGTALPARPARASNDPHTDAACAGKSTGDVVQIDSPGGKVNAICTLVARPVPMP